MLTILQGDAVERLRELPAESVHCVVTSPPFWGLRDYGAEGQLGLEKTPEEYVAKMVEVFREVRRVLRKDGTLWLNLGDSIQNKQLQMIPAKIALALQADGWWLRSDIIWAKPNPMPESCTDRPTKAHEYLFLLTKNANYFFDAEAIREPISPLSVEVHGRYKQGGSSIASKTPSGSGNFWRNGTERDLSGRNKRSVWTVATAPYPEAHFATYPPDLIKPCVLAGTSAKGCCAKCGAPWERVVEYKTVREVLLAGGETLHEGGRAKAGISNKLAPSYSASKNCSRSPESKTIGWQPTCPHDGKTNSAYKKGSNAHRIALLRQAARERGGEYRNEKRMTGWAGNCGCAEAETVPCTVLDPFAGSGTTGAVALELGRSSILIELNPKYVDMIRDRCNITPGLQLA